MSVLTLHKQSVSTTECHMSKITFGGNQPPVIGYCIMIEDVLRKRRFERSQDDL